MGCASSKAGDQVVTQAELVAPGHDTSDAVASSEMFAASVGCSLDDVLLEEGNNRCQIEQERDAMGDDSESKIDYHSQGNASEDSIRAATKATERALESKISDYLNKVDMDPNGFKLEVKHKRKLASFEAMKAQLKQGQEQPQVFVEKLPHAFAHEDSSSSMSLSQ